VKLPKAARLPWQCGEPTGAAGPRRGGASPKNKVKYSCPACSANVWGKPELNLICADCRETFVVQ
jgi:hypothetical protein